MSRRRLRRTALATFVVIALPAAALAGGRSAALPIAPATPASSGSRVAMPTAVPPDSLAPPGVRHNWLPKEGWVSMHWLPFEEPELAAALGTSAAGIRSYLSDDRRLLVALALRQGWRPGPLARFLTRRLDGRVTRSRLATLRWRTERVLTQGHLAQHVLFHSFHGPAIPAHAEQVFGVSRRTFLAARQAGLTPTDLALRQGRKPSAVRTAVLAILTGEANEGVRTESETRAQSRRMLTRQRHDLGCWMTTPLPKLDPPNPYGGPNGNPGTAPGIGRLPASPGCGGMDMAAA